MKVKKNSSTLLILIISLFIPICLFAEKPEMKYKKEAYYLKLESKNKAQKEGNEPVLAMEKIIKSNTPSPSIPINSLVIFQCELRTSKLHHNHLFKRWCRTST